MTWTLFVIIVSVIPHSVAISGEGGWKHSHSVNLGEYANLEECKAAVQNQEVLIYPQLPEPTYRCVKGWQRQSK